VIVINRNSIQNQRPRSHRRRWQRPWLQDEGWKRFLFVVEQITETFVISAIPLGQAAVLNRCSMYALMESKLASTWLM
jgi:hypothetical protein